jgi:hypothetical protein
MEHLELIRNILMTMLFMVFCVAGIRMSSKKDYALPQGKEA